MSKDSKQLQTETGQDLESTKQCYKKTLMNFDIWKCAVLEMKLPEDKLVQVKGKMKEIRNALRNLFKKRISELEDLPCEFSATNVADIHKIWELLEPTNKDESISFIRKGSDIMIDFFIDLQNLEIITKNCLSNFLNKEGGSRIISSYAFNRFCQPTWDMCKIYMNFNIKLSLLEGPATAKMGDLLKVLEEDAWRKIEFDYLKAQIMAYTKDAPQEIPYQMEHLFNRFIELEHMDKVSVENMQDFINHSMKHLGDEFKTEVAERDEIEANSLIKTKLVYDMISYLLRHHKDISIPENQESLSYDKMWAIEAGVMWLSSLYHRLYIRARYYEDELDPTPWKPDFLVDENENRWISLFSVSGKQVEEIVDLFGHATLKPNFEKLKRKKRIQTTTYLNARYDYAFYKIISRDDEESVESGLLSLIKHFKQAYYTIIEHYDDLIRNNITREKLHEEMEKITFYDNYADDPRSRRHASIRMNGSSIAEKKQNIIFFKTPNESTGYSEDEYTKTFASTGAYQPMFVPILRTKVSEEEVGELAKLIKMGARRLMLDGVVVTSARSVDSLQLAIKKLNQETSQGQQQEQSASDWRTIPFFVVGPSTHNALARLNNFSNPAIFPNPLNHEIEILGHNESGSGHKLAEFIKNYFSRKGTKQSQRSNLNGHQKHQDTKTEEGAYCATTSPTTVRLLYLIGSHQDSSLSENLSKHNEENGAEREENGNDERTGRIRFELVPTRVYSVEPETQPRFEPHELFPNHDCSPESGGDDRRRQDEDKRGKEEGDEERRRMEEEIKEELAEMRRAGNRAKKKNDWLVFFSPNSSRIVLENINDLLVQIKLKFLSLQRNPPASSFSHDLLHLDSVKIAAIGSTTAAFLASHFAFHPQVVPLKPNPSSLLRAILEFDNRLSSDSSTL
ncbi:hypothetical protein PtB15_15B83 [Puccinia triticina]|nr:hypothetical protein PtB15_15B83 [Puccinia triticina]